MKLFNVHHGSTVNLGREGENLARQIVFDVAEWQRVYGPGTVQLVAKRAGEQAIYPVAVTMKDRFACWTVTNADTAKKGRGYCELQYYSGDTLVKSETWLTFVADALGEPTADPPEPFEGWVEQVLAAGTEAAESARRAEQAATKNPKISEAGTWLVWDSAAGEYRDTGVNAAGLPGAPGQIGPPGEKGDPFVYSDFTPEQLEALRGPQGIQGVQGPQGIQGISGTPGAKGDTGATGATGPQGPKGDPFVYSDFTPEQLAALEGPQGPKGEPGVQGPAGPKGDSYNLTAADKAEIARTVLSELPTWDGGSY